MKRAHYAVLVILAVLVLTSLLLVSSSLAGAKSAGKKWGARATAFVVA